MKAMRRAFPRDPRSRRISTAATGPFNWVRGERVAPSDGLGVEAVVEPGTGRVIAEVPGSGARDVDAAVREAARAFEEWGEVGPRERGRRLLGVARVIEENLEDIARLEVRDTGKPIWEARVDVGSCADAFRFFGGVVAGFHGRHVQLEGGSFAVVRKEPLGVIGGIGAWNFPMQTCTWKVAPALAAGNAFVYKPAQWTPLTAVTLGEAIREAGIPDGVYNVVQGAGETGRLLCEHPQVAKLSFTGSVPTGVRVMTAGAGRVVPVTLELGGKSPLVVFPDADLESAVKGALVGNFLSQGEVCSNGTRVFVHSSIKKPFLDMLLGAVRKMKVGDPFEEDTVVGATITESHARKVLSYIEEARGERGAVVHGGERVRLPPPHDGGWYLSPCVVENARDEMRCVREEIFGSVLSLLEFDDEEEAVARANATEFGLAGAVFTRDIRRGHRVAARLKAGTVWINTFNLYPTELPFGGFKRSGVGRENGVDALHHFSQTKTVYVEMGEVQCGPLWKD
ncbi:unnamed protein product [Darwinula stevensoni]|uniref:Aldehyde dehydrogenase domain-containing protein n=1 Tax=Darwinula stevensoni TaxID=69355 RepID=A0A7R8XBE8_9CRUS|nr:unnamed protein product [Darwinula stevensoni]CAG0892753.1 unnamed protein product [Darwinula stevensoni]